jgi:hypothetical protein
VRRMNVGGHGVQGGIRWKRGANQQLKGHLWGEAPREKKVQGNRRFRMRRLPVVLSLIALPIVLVALLAQPAVAASPGTPMKGTWIFTQELMIPEMAGILTGRESEGIPFVDVAHLDDNMEVRTLSGVLHENGCGKVLSVNGGTAFSIPFSASVGVGDWSAYDDSSINLACIHFLYDCSGKPIGYAWVSRAGSPLFEGDLLPGDPKGPWVPENPDAPPAEGAEPNLVGWKGQTTITFFSLKGEPMLVPIPGNEAGVSELSGPFRATRVTGEPHR